MKKKLLWIGHANIQTGFGRVTQNVLAYLQPHYDISVIGIGFTGDPHPFPYKIYPAGNQGDQWGLNRLETVYRQEAPDVLMILMEPWNILPYVQTLRHGLGSKVKIVSYAVVDGLNMKADHALWLSKCDVCLFPTDFALEQAKAVGYHGYGFVIPHGVDPNIYKPCDQEWARKQIGIGNLFDPGVFMFGNVNMNQPRKRIDISVEAYARFLDLAKTADDAYLYLHLRKDLEEGWDIGNLAKYFGVPGRITVMTDEQPGYEVNMRYVYNSLDVQLTTTSGEGFGLTCLEGMACGIPQIIPDFAALGEWAKPASLAIPATERQIMAKQQNIVRYSPTAKDMAEAMLVLYQNHEMRQAYGDIARKHALQEYFRWPTIAAGFDEALRKAIEAEGVSGEYLVQAEAVTIAQTGPSGMPIVQEQR